MVYYTHVHAYIASRIFLSGPIGEFCYSYSFWSILLHNTKNSIPREHRLCRYCNEVCKTEKIESEEHVLQDCPLYYKSRMEFQTKCRNVINASNRGTTEPAKDVDDQNTNNGIILWCPKTANKIKSKL